METIDKYNIGKITESYLLSTLKENLINNIVDKMVAEFKEKARVEVEKEVNKLTINSLETFRDMGSMRDEFKLYCEWKE